MAKTEAKLEPKLPPWGSHIAWAVGLIATNSASFYACSKQSAEAEKIRVEIAAAAVTRTAAFAQEIAKYGDPADRALVLRAIEATERDQTVRDWARKELARLEPLLRELKQNTAVSIAQVVANVEVTADGGAGGSASTGPTASDAGAPINPQPQSKPQAVAALDAMFDRSKKLAFVSPALRPPRTTPVCRDGTARGAVRTTDDSRCRSSTQPASAVGSDEAPLAVEGKLFWRVKNDSGYAYCTCLPR